MLKLMLTSAPSCPLCPCLPPPPSYLLCCVCTGRYIATSVTSLHQMENGFNMWSFNGKLLYR